MLDLEPKAKRRMLFYRECFCSKECPPMPMPSQENEQIIFIITSSIHRILLEGKMMFLTGASKASSNNGGSKKSSADPMELAKEWKRNLQKEARKMDRDILNIKRQEDRAMKECQKLAKANQLSAAKILAKEIVRTRKTVERMYTTKAQLNSVANSLQTSMSMVKLSGCMAKSTEIMTAMNSLVSVKEISETMRSMAREMEKTGLVDEIIGDALSSLEDEGLETEANLEVEKVISEITAGVLSPASSAPTRALQKPAATASKTEQEAKEEEEVDEATQELLKRLQAL